MNIILDVIRVEALDFVIKFSPEKSLMTKSLFIERQEAHKFGVQKKGGVKVIKFFFYIIYGRNQSSENHLTRRYNVYGILDPNH